jgi:hypothetical protein
VGNEADAEGGHAMIRRVITSTLLRPILSPKWPKNHAPSGRVDEADRERGVGEHRRDHGCGVRKIQLVEHDSATTRTEK